MSTSPCSRVNPSSASLIAGPINAARVIVPYFFRAYSKPDTVPGTPTASQPIVRQAFDDVSVLVEVHVPARRTRGLLSKIEEGLSSIGKPDRHEAAAAQIAGGRIDHGQGISHRDSRIDRTAAALENVDTDLGRKVLCGDHHALFGGHGPRRGGIGGRAHNQNHTQATSMQAPVSLPKTMSNRPDRNFSSPLEASKDMKILSPFPVDRLRAIVEAWLLEPRRASATNLSSIGRLFHWEQEPSWPMAGRKIGFNSADLSLLIRYLAIGRRWGRTRFRVP